MLYNRVEISNPLVPDFASVFISIGDEEQELLASLIRQQYGKENFFATLIWEKKKKGSFLSGNLQNEMTIFFVLLQTIVHSKV